MTNEKLIARLQAALPQPIEGDPFRGTDGGDWNAVQALIRDLIREGQRVEWGVDSIGGGMTGTADEVRAWLDGWHGEYGARFDETIHLRRRKAAGEWEDATMEDLR